MYNWLVDLIGYVSTQQGQNSNIIYLSGVIVIMLVVCSVDLLYSLIYSLSKRRK